MNFIKKNINYIYFFIIFLSLSKNSRILRQFKPKILLKIYNINNLNILLYEYFNYLTIFRVSLAVDLLLLFTVMG